MEFPLNIWERPPGLGLCPLHILVTICSQMHQWLSLSPDNLVVLHARTCTGTERHLATFLAACHLIFSAGLDNVRLALDSLPPLGGRPRSEASGMWGSMGRGSAETVGGMMLLIFNLQGVCGCSASADSVMGGEALQTSGAARLLQPVQQGWTRLAPPHATHSPPHPPISPHALTSLPHS